MNIRLHRFSVVKRHALTISRGTSAGSENLLVEIEHEGVTGWGEMAPTSGGAVAETAENALRPFIEKHNFFEGAEEVIKESVELEDDAPYQTWMEARTNEFLASGAALSFETPYSPWQMQQIESSFFDKDWGQALRAALDMALHDWQGKQVGLPVWKLFGLDLKRIVPTSLTVGINPPDVIREVVPEILARTGAYALKVKLGNPLGIEADKEAFAAAQEAAIYPLAWRVDANGGWNVETAREMIAWLAEREVRFVEQPLPRGQEADLPAVHHQSRLPIFVDESVYVASDIPPLAANVDGVNLKLMKCGGLREALRIIHTCRAHGLKVMMGCMSESSLAITAAAHISPLADALDLDSHLNLNPDPFAGAQWKDGRVLPTDAPGLGVRRANA